MQCVALEPNVWFLNWTVKSKRVWQINWMNENEQYRGRDSKKGSKGLTSAIALLSASTADVAAFTVSEGSCLSNATRSAAVRVCADSVDLSTASSCSA